jgi:hypothetical protein
VASTQATLKLTSGLLLFSACSFVNSFDDLGEVVTASAGTSSAGTDSGGTSAASGAGGEGAIDTGGTPGQGGSMVGEGGEGATPGMAGMGGGPDVDAGFVLVGASVGTPTKYFMVSLDPATGKELTRVAGPRTLGIAYDTPRDEPDIWYVFLVNESGNPNDVATLSVRRYDESDGTFEELSSVEVPAPTNADSIAVLRNRVFYRSVVVLNNIPTTGFTLLDTGKLDDVRVMGQNQAPDLPEGMVGLLSHPSLAADGGAVSIIQQVATECAADADDPTIDLCPVRARRGTLGSTAMAMTIAAANKSVVVGQVPRKGGILGLAGWTAAPDAGLGRDIFVFPPKDFLADPNGLLGGLQRAEQPRDQRTGQAHPLGGVRSLPRAGASDRGYRSARSLRPADQRRRDTRQRNARAFRRASVVRAVHQDRDLYVRGRLQSVDRRLDTQRYRSSADVQKARADRRQSVGTTDGSEPRSDRCEDAGGRALRLTLARYSTSTPKSVCAVPVASSRTSSGSC